MKPDRIGVLLIAKNEENFINKTLDTILNQTIKPRAVVVVNDGSTDSTKDKIIHRFPEVIILDYPEAHESYTCDPRLARIFNYGLDELTLLDLDYLLLMGADHILPLNYLETLINHFDSDPSLVMASGTIKDETAILPRGSGRLYRNSFLKLIGYHFIEKYGHEDYHLFKALQLGFKVKTIPFETMTLRPTGTNYIKTHNIERGKTFKALGYSKLYMLFLFALKANPDQIKDITQGYDDPNTKLYEPELRKFVSKYQKKQLFHLSNIKKRVFG